MLKLSDSKYLLAYIVPLSVFISIYVGGMWSFFSLAFIFGCIPLIELLLPIDSTNHDAKIEDNRRRMKVFDVLLYSNLFIVYGLLVFTAIYLYDQQMIWYEWIGYVTALGILLGSSGINVAHELGHRDNVFERLLSKALLLPSHYMHFIIEHNLGHHKNVATPNDPATARRNETIFTFWVRSTINSYLNAWQIESKRLKRSNIRLLSAKNQMIQFTFIQMVYIIIVMVFLPLNVSLLILVSGVFSFLLLETINYIEHYGIVRQQMKSGRYEPVRPNHSWNADYPIGRILLYELTRHSDHHFKADRKYQILRSIENSPNLPWGYPGAMIMALIPPYWFKKIHPILDDMNSNNKIEVK